MLAETRKREDLRDDHLKRLASEKLLEANMDSDERVENKRIIRAMQKEQQERETEEAIIKVCVYLSKLCIQELVFASSF